MLLNKPVHFLCYLFQLQNQLCIFFALLNKLIDVSLEFVYCLLFLIELADQSQPLLKITQFLLAALYGFMNPLPGKSILLGNFTETQIVLVIQAEDLPLLRRQKSSVKVI